MHPAPDEVRVQLEQMLTSATFANAGHASRLLRYVVERTLAGDGEQLKEYVLGVEVFGRTEHFDPRLDTIVRVEARRLRAKLHEYYQGPGAADPVVISIVPGSYAPVFGRPDPPQPAPDPARSTAALTHSTTPARWVTRTAILAGAIAVAVVAGWWTLPGSSGADATSGIRIAVLPFAHFSTDPAVAMVAARITDGVTADLARVPELSVVSRTSAAQFGSEERSIRDVARALGATMVMESSLVVEAGGIHVVTRLVDASGDRKIWVSEYDSAPDQITALQRRIASDAAAVLKQHARR